MCEQMGWEPEEKEIPMDASELSINNQSALLLFNILPDVISDMSGIWLGKNYAGLLDIMSIYNMYNRREIFDLFQLCCREYEKFHEQQRKIRGK